METATETHTPSVLETLAAECAALENQCAAECLAVDADADKAKADIRAAYKAEIDTCKGRIAEIVKAAKADLDAAARLAGVGRVSGERKDRRPNRQITDADRNSVFLAVKHGCATMSDLRAKLPMIPEDQIRAIVVKFREDGTLGATGNRATMRYHVPELRLSTESASA